MLVRTDLPIADQMVQACHACLEAGNSFAQPKEPSFMALLAVRGEEELLQWRGRLTEMGIGSEIFYEPDPIVNGDTHPMGYTALTTEPIGCCDPRRKVLRKLPLWKTS